jgi:hypothetical protein
MAGLLTLIYIGILILTLVSGWIVFTKAGRPGWAIIIPFYNLYIFLTIAGKPGWWLILMFIPVVNIVISIIMNLGLAEKFGKGTGFAIGLVFLPIIFWPILAFSDAKYMG